MKLHKFTILIAAVIGVGFIAGYILGSIRYSWELSCARHALEQRQQNSLAHYQATLAEKVDLITMLNNGRVDEVQSRLNAEIDLWIISRNADARKGPWIIPETEPSRDTAILARVARQRAESPVSYSDSNVWETISQTLNAAELVEQKRYETIEHANGHVFSEAADGF